MKFRTNPLLTVLGSALLATVSNSQAQIESWDGSSSTNFATGANWADNSAPTTGGTTATRLQIGTTTAGQTNPPNALYYTATQATTIFAPAADRALVIGNGANATAVTGSMFITGGTFDSRGTTGSDILGNSRATGNLTIDGGNYTNVNGTRTVFLMGLAGSADYAATSNLTITTNGGSFTTGSLQFGNTGSNAGGGIVGTVQLNGGILETGSITEGAMLSGQAAVSSTINFNGGTLRARGADNANFISSTAGTGIDNAVVQGGGAIIDTNGFNIGISKALTAGTGSGGLTKQGDGTLTLSNVSTYIGDTLINNGTLALTNTGGLKFVIGADDVNNQITGIGTVSLDGLFTFDLTGASTTITDSWNIVDVDTLTESFTSNFSIFGFTQDVGGILWNGSANGADYQFSETSGVLTVIPEPSATLLGGLGLLALLRRRR